MSIFDSYSSIRNNYLSGITQSDTQDLSLLENRLATLESELKLLKDTSGTKLKYPMDDDSKKILRDILNETIFDMVWDDYYYYSTYFESLDGYRQDVGGTGSVDISDARVAVNSGTTSGSAAWIQKNPTNQSVLRWDRESRFRINFDMSATTNQEIRISIGDSSNGVTDTHYGFWVDDSVLKGTSSNGTSTATITLKTLSASTTYDLEAAYYPDGRVDFYVDGDLLGSLTDTSKLPSADADPIMISFFTFYIENQAAELKIAELSWFEYIQKR